MPLTVVCLFVRGPYPYTAEYVYRLERMARRFLSRPFRFVCLTDQPSLLPGIDTIAIDSLEGIVPPNGVGYWNKLRVFDKTIGFTGRMLYIDLDSLIVANLDDIVDFPANLALTEDAFVVERAHLDTDRFGRKLVRRFNGSVMVWDADGTWDFLWDTWTPAVADELSTDQDWIGREAASAVAMPLAWWPRISRAQPPWSDDAKVVLVKKPKNAVCARQWPWFDEAWGGRPPASEPSGNMRELTVVYPFFGNIGMLAEHRAIFNDYPEDLKARLHLIVVDDCSPKGERASLKGFDKIGLASAQLYRVTQKVRWNWLACRNIGHHHACTNWVLFTDIDHVLPASTFRTLLDEQVDSQNVYRLARVDAAKAWPYELSECPIRENKKWHPNTWLMTRAMYDAIGGYDERLSGCYGTDGEFRDRVKEHARAVVQLPDALLIRYPREVIPQASTTCYTRKNDPSNDGDLSDRRLRRAQIANWKPLRVTFPYEHVSTVSAMEQCV